MIKIRGAEIASPYNQLWKNGLSPLFFSSFLKCDQRAMTNIRLAKAEISQ